jgi:hypothetical protein
MTISDFNPKAVPTDSEKPKDAVGDKPADKPKELDKTSEIKVQQTPTHQPQKPNMQNIQNQSVQKQKPQKINMMRLLVPYLAIVGFAILFISLNSLLENFAGWLKQPLQLAFLFVVAVPILFVLGHRVFWFLPAILATLAVWALALCFESHWLLFNPDSPTFVPKFLVNDGWDIKNLFKARLYLNPGFWVALFFTLAVSGLEAYGMRVTWFKTGERTLNKTEAKWWGFGVVFFIAIDVAIALTHYPIMNQPIFQMVVNFCWLVFSVVGFELLMNLVISNIQE